MNHTSLAGLLQYKAWADQDLMHCLCEHQDKMPPEVLRKCVRLMNHIHIVDRIFVAHLSGQQHGYSQTNTEDTPTAEALNWDMQATNHRLQEIARAWPESEVHAHLKFTFTDGDKGSMSAEEMLLHLGLHSTYHRGQVSQMLKDNGIAPPRELLTRKLHLQEPDRRKA